MSKSAIPDAWDDNWETQADVPVKDEQADEDNGAPLPPVATLTKAERITRHEEANRKIWESADSAPQTFHYLEANSTVPLTSSFKPQVKVLARKPLLAKRDPMTGDLTQLSIEDEDEADKKQPQLTAEEIRARQKRDLEERQRRYDEARAKIFGESNPSSRGSSPGTVTPPPRTDSRQSTRGRGRGGAQRQINSSTASNGSIGIGHDARGQADARKLPSDHSHSGRELFDPNFSPKPDSFAQRHLTPGDMGRESTSRNKQAPHLIPQQQAPIRSPRGPDGSGRGGFGFARRGNSNG